MYTPRSIESATLESQTNPSSVAAAKRRREPVMKPPTVEYKSQQVRPMPGRKLKRFPWKINRNKFLSATTPRPVAPDAVAKQEEKVKANEGKSTAQLLSEMYADADEEGKESLAKAFEEGRAKREARRAGA